MKNNVYGLTSMIINENGDKIKDGTLLFTTKEKADEYLDNVNAMQENMNSLVFMKGSVRSHYEHDKWYTVSDTIADFVRTKIRFFVRNIDMHLTSEENPVSDTSEDFVYTKIRFVVDKEQ